MSIKSTLLLLLLVAITTSLTCSGNCPSDSCTSCWCGNQQNVVDIAGLCSKYDWNQSCCKCILARESQGNANAMSQLGTNPPNGPLTGLFQLDDLVRQYTCWVDSVQQLCSPDLNIDCAYKLYKFNEGFKGWTIWETSAKLCGCGKYDLQRE